MTHRQDSRPATSTELFRPLLETVPDALVLVNAEGRIVLANPQSETLFGYPQGGLEGLPVDHLVPTRLRGGHGEHRRSFFGDPKLRSMGSRGQLHGLRKDGTEFAIEINLAPVQTDGGLLVSAAIRDVTEQRRLQEQLERKNEELEEQYRRGQEANRLKSEFLANMSHELRTPLNAIIGFSEILHDGKAGELAPQQKEFTGDVLASARHLLQLINDVLDLAKVEAGKIEFHPEPVDLVRLVSEVRDVVRTLVARKRLKVTTEVDPDLTGLVLDPGKLKQVLYNYLSNAIKFSNDGGEVFVTATPKGAHHFRLEVRDTGIGIRREDLARLFVEFQQLDTSIAKKYQGTGLGLALTKRIVIAQGGSVGVSSEFGRGSAFHVILPRQTAPGAESRAPRAMGREGAPAVLVVEDDPRDLEQITEALLGGGYAVHGATNGERAIALCRERAFAGITLDLLLPDMSGWDVLHAIRVSGHNVTTPVIVVSVIADLSAAAAYAVQDYLVKPLDAGEILKSLLQCGVTPPHNSVLIVDQDEHAARELQQRLERAGYRTLHALDGAQAHQLARTARPAAAVIELTAHDDGLEVLARLRELEPGHAMAVIVSSRHKPGQAGAQRPRFIGGVDKGHDAGAAVVAELGRMLGGRAPGPGG
jgi:PAS domain S-box-containing protein